MESLSKSRYCAFLQCPKKLWLTVNEPNAVKPDEATLARMDTGNDIGDLAMGLFGDYVDVTTYREDGRLDLGAMIKKTKEEMKKGTPVICEASFATDGLYCAVDILKKDGDGWAVYEVKSTVGEAKDVYLDDIAFQKTVLNRCGVNPTGIYLVNLNRDYVYDGSGTYDVSALFKIHNVSVALNQYENETQDNITAAKAVLASSDAPACGLSECCKNPYSCGALAYCMKDIPKPSVFDLYRIHFKTALELYNEDIVTFEDAETHDIWKKKKGKTIPVQKRQVKYTLHDSGTYIDKNKLRAFLQTLQYPLYFLDFETVQPPLPMYKGTRPYQKIPFQYSLHIVRKPGAEAEHKEYLGTPETDPRCALAEQLCRDMPEPGTMIAYHDSTECGVIDELVKEYPNLSEPLKQIIANPVDLLIPFRQGYYYNGKMGGSFSVKSVLPAVFPNDPSLNYKNLDGIHNGTEAMTVFPTLDKMPEDERETTRKSLLQYCELDTLAMVKLWQELERAANE